MKKRKICKKIYKNNYPLFSKTVLHTKVINKLSLWPSQPLSLSPSWEFKGVQGLYCTLTIPVLFLQYHVVGSFSFSLNYLVKKQLFLKLLFIKQVTLDHLHFMISIGENCNQQTHLKERAVGCLEFNTGKKLWRMNFSHLFNKGICLWHS